MHKPVTTIFFGPQAAGKTYAVNQQMRDDPSSVHFDLDQTVEAVYKRIAGSNEVTAFRAIDPTQKSVILGVQEHLQQLTEEYQKGTPHVIVDYFSKAVQLVEQVILLSRHMGRLINLEGITVNPELSYSRLLERRSKNQNLPSELAEFLQQRQKALAYFLQTYEIFPEQFLSLAETADIARLRDNKGAALDNVAVWRQGDIHVLNQPAYDEFLRLKDLQPNAASFEAKFLGSKQNEAGDRYSTFEIRPLHFFGAHKPALGPNGKSPQPKF